MNGWLGFQLPSPSSLRAAAMGSNIEENPDYDSGVFLSCYPQFSGVVPQTVLDMWVDAGKAAVNIGRFGEYWLPAIGFFIAHHLVLYLRSTPPEASGPLEAVNAGEAKGFRTGKSAGSLSVSYDYSSSSSDFEGWGTYKETEYGRQFAELAKLLGTGGFYVC
jgi:hypothetical protein